MASTPGSGHGRLPRRQGLYPNPAWYKLTGCAKGLALAAGHHRPEPEHFLVSMIYSEDAIAPSLRRLGSSEQDLLEALARPGVRVPEVDPPR